MLTQENLSWLMAHVEQDKIPISITSSQTVDISSEELRFLPSSLTSFLIQDGKKKALTEFCKDTEAIIFVFCKKTGKFSLRVYRCPQ